MKTFLRALRRSAVVCSFVMLPVACSGPSEFSDAPRPENMDQIEPALAAWIDHGWDRVQENPEDFEALLALCRIYDANDLFDVATDCYEVAVDAKPEQAKVWYLLAQTRWAGGDLDGAIEAMEESIGLFPHYAPSHARLGSWRVETGDLDAAEASFDRVADISPDDPIARVGAAYVMLERGEFEAAGELLREVLRDRPGDEAAVILMGEVQRQISGVQESLAGLELYASEGRSIGNDPWGSESEMFVVGYSAQLRAAENYLEKEQYDEAIAVLESIRDGDPYNLRVMGRLAGAYRHADRLDEARTVLEQLVAIGSDDYAAHLELASVHELSGDSEQALEHADLAIGLRPDLAVGHARRGAILRRTQRYAEAIESFRSAEEITPGDKMIARAIGDCYTRLADWSGAAASYERALAIDDEDPELYSRAGFAYLKLGRLGDAENAFSQALAHDVRHAEAVTKMLEQVQRIRAGEG